MDYQFHEIRKGERAKVLNFATSHGCKVKAGVLRHHLSLAVENEGKLVAAGLCVEREPGQFEIEIVSDEAAWDEALITELVDRCLRKAQAEDISAARLSSPTDKPTQVIWSHTNWLDGIEETPPPGEPSTQPTTDGQPSQAA